MSFAASLRRTANTSRAPETRAARAVAKACVDAHNGLTMRARRPPRGTRTLTAALLVAATAASAAGASAPPTWQRAAPLPDARGEVAAAVVGGEIAVVGGFDRSGLDSARVDAYSPARDAWRRLPDMPAPVDHAMAAAAGGRLYVVGGYGRSRAPRRSAWILSPGGRWRALPRLPAARAAGGAAILRGRLYVVGGVGPRGLARTVYVLDLRRSPSRWSALPGPTPRQHLAVASP